jgi:hypothetical protein
VAQTEHELKESASGDGSSGEEPEATKKLSAADGDETTGAAAGAIGLNYSGDQAKHEAGPEEEPSVIVIGVVQQGATSETDFDHMGETGENVGDRSVDGEGWTAHGGQGAAHAGNWSGNYFGPLMAGPVDGNIDGRGAWNNAEKERNAYYQWAGNSEQYEWASNSDHHQWPGDSEQHQPSVNSEQHQWHGNNRRQGQGNFHGDGGEYRSHGVHWEAGTQGDSWRFRPLPPPPLYPEPSQYHGPMPFGIRPPSAHHNWRPLPPPANYNWRPLPPPACPRWPNRQNNYGGGGGRRNKRGGGQFWRDMSHRNFCY